MTAPFDRVAFPVLIGDIGGTNARFAVIEHAGAAIGELPIVQTASYRTIEDAIADTVIARIEAKPRSAMLALAGPIAGDRVPLTNSHWVVEPKKIIERFAMEEMILLNDFEALSLALPDLAAEDIDPIGGGAARPDGARVVVGPGTGLGAGALIHARDTWIPVPGEGGHVDLGPVSDRDFALWPHLERAHGRMSGETLLCGAGLVRLYRGVCAADAVTPLLSRPSEIVAGGLANENAQAAETLSLFATYLGRFAGDLALVFMAHGGVYLAGGISGRIAPALKSGAFREAFLAKAPHRTLLDGMRTAIVVKSNAAHAGIAAFARAPTRFAVDLTGRHWRA